MKIIDAHIHYISDHPAFLALLTDLNLKLLTNCVPTTNESWRQQAKQYADLSKRFPEQYAWCTSFDLPDFHDPDYAEKVIRKLDEDFAAGAVGCKAWKNIGMTEKKPSGEYLMIDDPIFDPIFSHLAKQGKPLLFHIGEPLACWQPLTEDSPHCGYYKSHPQWHMYGKPGFPSHEQIIAARDRAIEKNPKLRMVGAHLGSLEYDVREVAIRLEKYPNFAVDTSGRTHDLVFQDQNRVKDFFMRYPERILFGIDAGGNIPGDMPLEELEKKLASIRREYEWNFDYFGSDKKIDEKRAVRGLALPDRILKRFFFENAAHWFPGVA